VKDHTSYSEARHDLGDLKSRWRSQRSEMCEYGLFHSLTTHVIKRLMD